MIPHSVLPGLAHWFGLTPPVLERMPAIEVHTFLCAVPEKKDR